MSSLNQVMLIGNVGKEAEMRFTPSGKPVTSFSVAVNSKYGENESTEWFNIITWNELAETCNQYITKGQQVFVEGRLQTRSWESDDGQRHYKTEVIANKVMFLGQRKQSEETTPEIDEEDIPF
jgi:single-strand DNA-binding protein